MSLVPVIAIDGPTASGKGALAERVAEALGWHYLDSGALYRLVALYANWQDCAESDDAGLAALGRGLPARFDGGRVFLQDIDVTGEIRAPGVGDKASRIAVKPALRDALLSRQRNFRLPPGLVADGRDMATVVFPDAALKVFLTAELRVRAGRRHKQLIEKGFSASLDELCREIALRDERDANREVAPLVPAPDATIIDSSEMTLDEVVAMVVEFAVDRRLVDSA
ncbi:MAG: (d)CMP kinase [Burkholderiaceae bacterium]